MPQRFHSKAKCGRMKLRFNKSPIAVEKMKGLRRNDDAMKNNCWYQKASRLFVHLNMDLDNIKIESIKNYFKTRPVLKAYLFGSYVRGNANSESDIDILVDLDYSQRIGLQFIQMKLDLEKLLNNKVDLVSSNGISKYIKPIVDGEKRLIYAK